MYKTIFFELRPCPLTKEMRAYIKDLDITDALMGHDLEVKVEVDVERDLDSSIVEVKINSQSVKPTKRAIELLDAQDIESKPKSKEPEDYE